MNGRYTEKKQRSHIMAGADNDRDENISMEYDIDVDDHFYSLFACMYYK